MLLAPEMEPQGTLRTSVLPGTHRSPPHSCRTLCLVARGLPRTATHKDCLPIVPPPPPPRTLLDVWGIFESLAGRKDTVRGPAPALPCTSPPKGSGHPSQKWQALAPCSDPLTHPIRSADFPAEPALES
ncbi:hypothetical protein MJT46_006425 [Ovis ammon polii x Ovis aries]|nr:hypothetical protein MJT46_006425 [Ovis ammon polii x Ovis aries]